MFWEKLEISEADTAIMPNGDLVEKFRCPKCGLIKFFVDGHTNQWNFCNQCGQRLLFPHAR